MAIAKAQSVVEYMTTYGWMILILAVALAALYLLGVFNSSSLAQKALPGSCSVLRPDGAGTTYQISLQGACLNLQPKYVAEFGGMDTYASSSLPCKPAWEGTVSAWVYLTSYPTAGNTATVTEDCGGNLTIDSNGLVGFNVQIMVYPSCHLCTPSNTAVGVYTDTGISLDRWYFLVGNYTMKNLPGGGIAISICAYNDSLQTCNSVLDQPAPGSGVFYTPSTFTFNAFIGVDSTMANSLNGYISNVQYYTTSLGSGESNELYGEGIGGSPISLTSLQNWWPLNGDASDYSGNNANTIPSNVIFITDYNYQPV